MYMKERQGMKNMLDSKNDNILEIALGVGAIHVIRWNDMLLNQIEKSEKIVTEKTIIGRYNTIS